MINKKSIHDICVKGKRVFVRVDFNVPTDKTTGLIKDDTRIREAVPTIADLKGRGARVILASHKGRYKEGFSENRKMDRCAERLAELLGAPVKKLDECVGEEVKAEVMKMNDGDVILLENLRFHAEEEKNGEDFAKGLADLAEIYVNDAFGAAHRAHASTEGITHYLPSVAGLLMEKEISIMAKSLEAPEHPFTAILGGAKISDKIGVIDNLINKCDRILVGGGMAYTFLKAQGQEVGKSLLEEDKLELAASLLKKAEEKGVHLLLPVDHVVAAEFKADAENHVTETIGADEMGLDIGPKTVELYVNAIADSKLVIWNGPMGVFEMDAFNKGTFAVAKAVAEVNGTTIVGGGDSVSAVKSSGYADRITHISTGGGASLELMEGKVLPGLAALNDLE